MTILLAGLGLGPPDMVTPKMVALVGSGGKTTLMFALAHEAVAQGWRVLTTTTTKIFFPTPEQNTSLILSSDPQTLVFNLRHGFKESLHQTAAAGFAKDTKLRGLAPNLLDLLHQAQVADLILVEADGSRGRPLKAPALHEPVIPGRADVVVMVAGLGGLDRPLMEDNVFRPEVFSRLSGLALGQKITAADLARVLWHPAGLVRTAPEQARVIPFLNQADRLNPQKAEAAAWTILAAGAGRADRAILGSLLVSSFGVHVVRDEAKSTAL